MGNIRKLPKALIEKIAAGEVVERPASVVKELVENSLDAGAKAVRVEILQGGRSLIRIEDDGCGIGRDDLELAIVRHATSKIAEEEDLFNIMQFGFRGEALSAIGAVSKMTISSKLSDALEGWSIHVAGEKIEGPTPVGCNKGTTIEVKDLYFNTPAREKFLRSKGVEFGHIASVFEKLSLISPAVRFELVHEGRVVKVLPSVVDWKDRILSSFNIADKGSLIDLEEIGDGTLLKGVVGLHDLTTTTGKHLHMYVNGRPVLDKMLTHAVMSGYGESLLSGKYPVAVLNLHVDPGRVDVNVHPSKREVRFDNHAAIHDFVMSSIRKHATGKSSTKGYSSMQFHSDEKPSVNFMWAGEKGTSVESPNKVVDVAAGFSPRYNTQAKACGYQKEGGEQNSLISDSHLHVVGSLSKTYILCQGVDGELVIVDQHAAHERLGFDELKKEFQKGAVSRQSLLLPQQVDLNTQHFSVITEERERFDKIGFEIEPFGERVILVKAHPAIIGHADVASLLEKLAQDIMEYGSSEADEDLFDRLFATIACHRQVRAGDMLSVKELQHLVDEMIAKKIEACPHGRPVMVRVDKREIEKWFKR
ncbi:MAG: DNA mismatch repair endonuclease MutL [Pseudomonadota bacterium]